MIMATISFFWQPFDVTELNISNRLQPVSLTHPFGTDHFGRDMLSMIMVGYEKYTFNYFLLFLNVFFKFSGKS